MFGSVSAFYFTHVAGLQRTSRGWTSFKVQPNISAMPRLDGASAWLETVSGRVEASWARQEHGSDPEGDADQASENGGRPIEVNITVPPGVQCEAIIPFLGSQSSALAR